MPRAIGITVGMFMTLFAVLAIMLLVSAGNKGGQPTGRIEPSIVVQLPSLSTAEEKTSFLMKQMEGLHSNLHLIKRISTRAGELQLDGRRTEQNVVQFRWIEDPKLSRRVCAAKYQLSVIKQCIETHQVDFEKVAADKAKLAELIKLVNLTLDACDRYLAMAKKDRTLDEDTRVNFRRVTSRDYMKMMGHALAVSDAGLIMRVVYEDAFRHKFKTDEETMLARVAVDNFKMSPSDAAKLFGSASASAFPYVENDFDRYKEDSYPDVPNDCFSDP